MSLTFAAMLIVNHDFPRPGDHNQLLFAVGHIPHGRVKANGTA